MTTGQGSGALIVIATALAGGFALSRRRWTAARASASVLGVRDVTVRPPVCRVRAVVLGAATLVVWPVTGLPSLADPRGLWAAVLYGGLLVLLALATAVPLRPVANSRPQPIPTTSTKGTDREQAILA